jgi:hypothetical protein
MLKRGTLLYHKVLGKYGIVSKRWSVTNPEKDEDGLGDMYMVRPIEKEDRYCPHIWSEGLCYEVVNEDEQMAVLLKML